MFYVISNFGCEYNIIIHKRADFNLLICLFISLKTDSKEKN